MFYDPPPLRPFPVAKLHRIVLCMKAINLKSSYDFPKMPLKVYAPNVPFVLNGRHGPYKSGYMLFEYFAPRSDKVRVISYNGPIFGTALPLVRQGIIPFQKLLTMGEEFDLRPLFEIARDLDAVDYMIRQYWENSDSIFFALPKDLVRKIAGFLCCDAALIQSFDYDDRQKRAAKLGK